MTLHNQHSLDKLVESLKGYPHIHSRLVSSLGTVELSKYLEHLMYDTRDYTRTGFPVDVLETLLMIFDHNQELLVVKGLIKEDNDFGITVWDLPKNF